MEDLDSFFRLVYGLTSRGYMCVARLGKAVKDIREEYFMYPEQLPQAIAWCEQSAAKYNIYFCPQLLAGKKRNKETVALCPNIWSDLDTCDPSNLLVVPTVTVRTSPGRYQAYWALEPGHDVQEAEELAKRIAYFHAKQGADRSGWDLTQLLRVPGTYNWKYQAMGTPPTVEVIGKTRTIYREDDFAEYPQLPGLEHFDLPIPEPDEVIGTADELLERYRRKLRPVVSVLFHNVPEEDWSKPLFALEQQLFEASMSREEVYKVVTSAKCNKFARDNRPDLLWRDVLRAEAKYNEHFNLLIPTTTDFPDLVTAAERDAIEPGFVERYIEWAKSLGDAAWQYHQAGAFILLSSLLAGPVRLPTSFGTIIPNMWFMILADTTLTRKSTSMDLAMDLLMEIDPDAMLATDGSMEGLLTSLSTRPGRPSVFLRDEFSGLLEQMTKRDYMAGMAEVLTKLYDGKYQKRILRKETIEVKEPILNLFAGGIKSKITSLLTEEYVSSGFIPRFVMISAESDPSRLRPLGPPTTTSTGRRDEILVELRELVEHYRKNEEMTISATGGHMNIPKRWDASLTPSAWNRYNEMETAMVGSALTAEAPELLTPVFDRLAKSGLRAALLIACARQRGSEVIVDERDIVHAFSYVQSWRDYVVEIIQNVGKTSNERLLDLLQRAINRKPGVTRSELMRSYHLDARTADAVFATLEQRALITRQRHGRAETFYAVSIAQVKPRSEPQQEEEVIRV